MKCSSECIAITKNAASFSATCIENDQVIGRANVVIVMEKRIFKPNVWLRISISVLESKNVETFIEDSVKQHCIKRFEKLFFNKDDVIWAIKL